MILELDLQNHDKNWQKLLNIYLTNIVQVTMSFSNICRQEKERRELNKD